jgi:GTPase
MASEEKCKTIRRKIDPLDDTGYTSFTCAVLGNVDAGKSSLVGHLTTGILDDGNGLSRKTVFVHPHEGATGRTSDISYQYLIDNDSKRIISLVDLAGHEAYFKTTVSGVNSSRPDVALVCISDLITKMTYEHLNLCVAVGIPYVILFTKTDSIPENVGKSVKRNLQTLLKQMGRNLYQVKNKEQIEQIGISTDGPVMFVDTSSKTGSGIDLVKYILNTCEKKVYSNVKGFVIDHVFYVKGCGRVVSGMVGEKVTVGDTLFLGPFGLKSAYYIPVKVRSIHNDYKFSINSIESGKRGCLCISSNATELYKIRKGMVLTPSIPNNNCRKFSADINILHHHTTIRNKYNCFLNSGMIRSKADIVGLRDKNKKQIDNVRAGDSVTADFELANVYHLEPGQLIMFRENLVRGAGIVVSVEELETALRK